MRKETDRQGDKKPTESLQISTIIILYEVKETLHLNYVNVKAGPTTKTNICD